MMKKIILLMLGFVIFTTLISGVLAEGIHATMEGSETCYDSDGGKDYYVKGYIEEGTELTGIAMNWDECEVDGTLDEFYCENGVAKDVIYRCFGGCSDGACLKCAEGGLRVEEDMFCSSQNIWLPQRGATLSCDNNFECYSELCKDGKCVNKSLIQKIVDWFKNLFS